MADILRDFGEMSVKLRDQILADAKQSDTPKEQKQSNVTEHNQKPATWGGFFISPSQNTIRSQVNVI